MSEEICRSLQEKLSAYADAALDLTEKKKMETHLVGCAVCRKELSFMRSIKSAIADLPAPEFPKDLKPIFLAEARRQRESSLPRPSLVLPFFSYGAWAGLAAGLAALLIIFTVSHQERRPTISLNAMLAAHEEYALSRPLAPTEIIYAQLPQQVETAGDNLHDL